MIEKEVVETQAIREMLGLNATQQMIYINVTIDTDAIIRDYKTPSTNPAAPTQVNPSGYFYMVATRDKSQSAGTNVLEVKAQVGDHICWSSQSETSNMDHSAYIYKITYRYGDKVFDDSKVMFYDYEKEILVPKDSSPLDMKSEIRSFPFMDVGIQKRGNENYNFFFAIYKRGDNGKQQLYGYFMSDPSIVVNQ